MRFGLPEASIYASNVSKIPEVRAFLLNAQRQLAAQGNTEWTGAILGPSFYQMRK